MGRFPKEKVPLPSSDCHDCHTNESAVFWHKCSKSCRGVLSVILCMVHKSYIHFCSKVIFYSTSIFKSAGFKDQWPVYCTILLGVVQVIMTFVCVLIVDKVGRRILLLIGMIGMCISAFGLAAFSILANKVRF